MTTEAFAGLGATFERESDDSSGVYVALGEVKVINPPNKSANTIDATTLASPGGYGEFIVGLKDSGEAGFTANFTEAAYTAINDDFELRVAHNYQIVLADTAATTFQFAGIVTGLDISDITPEGIVDFVCTMKITGVVEIVT